MHWNSSRPRLLIAGGTPAIQIRTAAVLGCILRAGTAAVSAAYCRRGAQPSSAAHGGRDARDPDPDRSRPRLHMAGETPAIPIRTAAVSAAHGPRLPGGQQTMRRGPSV